MPPVIPDKPVQPTQPEKPDFPFTDVTEGDWCYDAVRDVYEKGLMQGVSATLFAPDQSTSRGMIVSILYRLEGSPAVSGSAAFTDVTGDTWCASAVVWASANGIVNGFTDGSFRPDQAVSRQEIAAFLYRYAQYKGYDTTRGGMAIREFTDYDAISAYALSAMDWCVNAGVLQGSAAKRLNPQSPASRAHVAAMLSRFCRSVQN